MSCKKNLTGLAYGVAVSALVLVPLSARAQGDMSTGTTMMDSSTSGSMSTGMMMSNSPMMVTGTVLRYYVDRAGYVTAMDIQTANGVQFVRFSPGMGQRLYSTYPVGGQASVYVMGSQSMGMTRMDVVSMGANMPAPGTMMTPMTVTDAELLDAQPYIMAGTKMTTTRGTLRDLIVNDEGEIVGLVLMPKDAMMKKSMMKNGMMNTVMSTTMTASPRLMMMSADGRMMPVMMKDGTASVALADGTSVELARDANGAYVVPESMTGARMLVAASDGTTMDIDTQNGKLMVKMADGSMAPINDDGTVTMSGMMSGGTMMTGGRMMNNRMMMNDMMGGTLVRVPRELRHIAPGYAGTERVTPLFKGAAVEVTGYSEAPRYGVLSTFDNRISASTLVVNGRAVGAIGVPMMSKEATKSLLKLNIGGNTRSAEEMRAAGMGYSVYGTGAQMGTGGMMNNGGAMMNNGGAMSTTDTTMTTDGSTTTGTTTTTGTVTTQ